MGTLYEMLHLHFRSGDCRREGRVRTLLGWLGPPHEGSLSELLESFSQKEGAPRTEERTDFLKSQHVL